MTDEDDLIRVVKNKGRSASVCFPARADISPHQKLPTASASASVSVGADADSTVADDVNHVRYFRRSRPATRSQSARLSTSKSHQKRMYQTGGSDNLDDGRRIKAGVSDPKLYVLSISDMETHSPTSIQREGSFHQETSIIRNFHRKRKSATFLDIPKAGSDTNRPAVDDKDDVNSYRLRSFSFTTKGLVNRGDSFRRRQGYCNSGFHRCNEINSSADHRHCAEDFKTPSPPSLPSPVSSTVPLSLADVPSQSKPEQTTTYNVSVMGAAGVGKTSLISQFMTSECINPYERERDGPSQQTVSIMLNGEESQLCFHELKHSKVFQKKYVADAFLVLYSVVDKSTFQNAQVELSKLQDSNVLHHRPAILVGNKIDLARSRTVSLQDGKCLACTFRVKHVEISVGINHNVDELLVGTLNQIRLRKQCCEEENTVAVTMATAHHWYKNRAVIRASMKARQMFTWIFGREDSKFKNCENLYTL